MKKLISIFLFVVLIQNLLTPSIANSASDLSAAQSYLLSHATNAWSTIALASLGAPSIPSEYLRSVDGSTAIEYEAPILAITALNQDPRTFGNKDYVEALKNYFDGNQIGDAQILNDDIFGILALLASGESPEEGIVSQLKSFVLSKQNSDNGWSYVIGGASDSNTTAAAVTSLIAAGLSPADADIQNALDYLKSVQNDDGGFAYAKDSLSDSSSTSWIVWALNALKINPAEWSKSGNAPISYLQSNQDQAGFFRYQNGSSEDSFSPITTAYAVIALSGKTLPLHTIEMAAQTFAFRIEGSIQTVCEGKTNGPTALDIIKNAASLCGYTYSVKDSSFGQYLNKINGDEASGMTGWLYFVNNLSPSVGAADYNLQTGDAVLWYFGDFGWQPTRLNLSAAEAEEGQNVTATVESFNGSAWSPVNDADVYFGASQAKTNSSGQASLSPLDGYYKIYAEKEGFVRSNAVLLKIGQPENANVSLSASVDLGKVKGEATSTQAIAFTVNPSTLDFGELVAKETANRTLTFRNTGTTNIKIQAQVGGDTLFTENLTLNDAFWRMFELNLPQSGEQDVNTSLTVPLALSSGSGPKSGEIVFWANPQ